MSREIKFRVWDKVLGEMLYPKWEEDYVGGGNRKIGLIIYRAKDGRGHSSLSWCLTHPESFEVEQFASKQDRNGEEVYDGTKLSYENLECCEICTVFWDDEDASWRVDFDDNSDCTLSDLDKSLITVIGTIHDKDK